MDMQMYFYTDMYTFTCSDSYPAWEGCHRAAKGRRVAESRQSAARGRDSLPGHAQARLSVLAVLSVSNAIRLYLYMYPYICMYMCM